MASPVCADVSFQYAGLSLFGPSRLEPRSKRLQGAVPEGLAVAEAEGQRVGQDDVVATDQAPSPMKKLKPSDFADKAAFQKEQRRTCKWYIPCLDSCTQSLQTYACRAVSATTVPKKAAAPSKKY